MNNYKEAPQSIITRNIKTLMEPTGNIYKSIAVVSKRARGISSKMKVELKSKLAEFASSIDNLEEVFENREQIEISKHYEKLPKATQISTEEFLAGNIYYRKRDEDVSPKEGEEKSTIE